MLPFAAVSPFYAAYVFAACRIFIVAVAGCDYAAPDYGMLSLFSYYNIAYFYFVYKLPCFKCGMSERARRVYRFLHLPPHFFLGRICRQVTQFVPLNSHYAAFIVIIPVNGVVARRIYPIVNIF